MHSSSLLSDILKPTALVLSMAMLTACGGDDKAATTAKIDPSQLADVQEITINNGAEPESLDPHIISGVPGSGVARQMFVGLTTTSPDGKTIPGMAESWESDDNKTWTFHLRDANWSNGDPVTADDFVYSFKRVANPETGSHYASYLADAKIANAQDIIDGKAKVDTLGVKAIDAKTFQVTLSEPVPYFPDMLIHTPMKPVNKKVVEEFGEKWTSPANIVVNGPYKLSEWVVNEKIVLERNPSYYDNEHTTIDKATLLAIPESSTDINRYKAGEIDITYTEVPTEQFAKLKEEIGDEVTSAPRLCTYFYEYNINKAPFDDVRVREALSLAFDRDTITDKVLAQGQTPAYRYTHVATDGGVDFTPEWASWDKEKRIAEAKKLLNEAGYDESNPLKFELLYNTSEEHKKIATAVQQLWKQDLGFVDVTLNNQEWKTYLDSRRNGKQQMARAAWCGDYNEASTFLNVMKTGNNGNYGGYSSKVVDDLMAQTTKAGITPKQRTELYNQVEAQLATDVPDIWIYHYTSPRLVKSYVTGFNLEDPLNNWQIKDLSIAKH